MRQFRGLYSRAAELVIGPATSMHELDSAARCRVAGQIRCIEHVTLNLILLLSGSRRDAYHDIDNGVNGKSASKYTVLCTCKYLWVFWIRKRSWLVWSMMRVSL